MGGVTSASFVADPVLIKEQIALVKHFGYLPVYAPTTQDLHYGKLLLGWILEACPGYQWIVEIRDGVVSIWNADLGSSWGFRTLVDKIDNDGRLIKSAACQLLEQHSVRSQRADPEELLYGLKRDRRGEAVRSV